MTTTNSLLPLLIDSAIKGTVILGLAALAALWLRRGSAASRHMAWQLGLLGVLALPVVNMVMPGRLHVLPAAFSRLQAMAPAASPAIEPTAQVHEAAPAQREESSARAEIAPPAAAAQGSVNTTAPIDWQGRVLRYALLVWAIGVAVVLGRLGIGLLVARWYTRKARALDAIEWASLNETMSFAVGLGHPVKLLKSERAATPMTFGVLNPVVLLPADADEWPEDRRRIVLLHELAHVHRLDSLTHLFASLACAVYWFNPVVWITAGRLRAEAERACDDWVLRAGMRASTYADHLLDMVRTIGRLHTPAVALPMAQRSTFEGRLLAILEPGLNRDGLTRGQGLLLTSVIALVIFPLAAMAPATASPNANANLPMSSAFVSDTSKQAKSKAQHAQDPQVEQDPQYRRRPKRGFISDITKTALDAVSDAFRRGEVDKAVQGALKGVDVGEITHDALKSVDLGRITHDALKEVDLGKITSDAWKNLDTDQQASSAVINALITAVTDSDLEVRRQAVHALGQQEDPRAIAALSRALREDTDASVRRSAAWALGQIEDARAVPALSDALRRDQDVEVRRQAAWALGQIEDATAVEALTAAMRDADKGVRHQAVWALGQIEDRASVPALAVALRDSDPEIRKQAAWALGNIEDRAAVPALTAAVGDSDEGVREQAVWALGNIEVEEAVAPLITALTDAQPRVRKQAAWALGQVESSRGVDGLARALREDRDVGVREQAAWALGQIEDAAALPALADALKDASPTVRKQAAWAIGQIERRPAPQQLLEALRDEDVGVRRTAVWALGQLEDPNSAAALRAAIKDPDNNVKHGALRALMNLGDEAATEALVELLKDPDPAVRRMATQALGRGGMHWPNPHPQPRPQPRPQPQPRPHGW